MRLFAGPVVESFIWNVDLSLKSKQIKSVKEGLRGLCDIENSTNRVPIGQCKHGTSLISSVGEMACKIVPWAYV